MENRIYSREDGMKNRIGTLVALLAAGVMATVIWLRPLSGEGQSHPKLDCQKMALDYAKALENVDYKAIVRLRGQPYSEKQESEAKQQLTNPEVKKLFASIIEMIRLFPKIGEIPDWVTEVKTEYQYIQGNDVIEMHGEFVLREDNWIIQDLEPRGGETLNEETKAQYAGELSPAPPEGQKAVDAGINELVVKLIAAVQQKSWNEVMATGAHPGDCGLDSSDPPGERERALKLLSQFPSVGPIPAPAKSFRLALKGTLDSRDSEAEVGFQWPGNQLKIAFVNFK
jgi:hypothetical protein